MESAALQNEPPKSYLLIHLIYLILLEFRFEPNETITHPNQTKEPDTESSQSVKINNDDHVQIKDHKLPENSSGGGIEASQIKITKDHNTNDEMENHENSSNSSQSNDTSIISQSTTTLKKTKKINANRLNGGAGKRLNYRDLEVN